MSEESEPKHIFISYRRENPDQGFAYKLVDDLERAGHIIWIDKTGIKVGVDFADEIQDALNASYAHIVILSPNSVDSEWVRREWRYTLSRKQSPLYPVVIRDVELPLDLINLDYADFREEHDKALERLLNSLPYPPMPPPPSRSKGIGIPHWIWAAGIIVGLTLLIGVPILASVIGRDGGTIPESTEEPASTPVSTSPTTTSVTHNADWSPVIQDFDGVEMALVPAGCFMMGCEDGEYNEQPVHEVCFDEQFWIDVYEVTNSQFQEFGGEAEWESCWEEDNCPRENITWFEASAFCEQRSVRLPSEAEWEYSARGPDSLAYPWGNEFVTENVIFAISSELHTWDVGSKTDGSSWIGAFDMSGNVWEWTSSAYRPYPYEASNETVSNDYGGSLVLRGGGWYDTSYDVRAACRLHSSPEHADNYGGFRCARNFDPADLTP